MKLKTFNVAKQGDGIRIDAQFNDRFRQPLTVKIETEKSDGPTQTPLWEGDAHDMAGLLSGLAEIAWASGWRPRGLRERLLMTIDMHKIPKAEG